MDIKKRVHRLVKFYGSRDPWELVKSMDVVIVEHRLEEVRGFYNYFRRINIIYLDERLSEQDKRFVLAHELGHMMLHRGVNAVFMDTRTQFNTNRYEIEANNFAMELLIPDAVILENINLTTCQLSRLIGYDERLVELRLRSFRGM